MNDLISCIKEHEGLSLYAYKDSLGYDTLGYGRCIDRKHGKGITKEEAEYLLVNDIKECILELSKIDWWNVLDQVRKEAIIELCFNIGIKELSKFYTMIDLVKEKKFNAAASDLLDTLWAKQVGKLRSNNIATRLCSGSYEA